MPSLPMYTPAPSPDGYYQTLTPGGYESWHLTFSDPAAETLLVLSLLTGCPYHPTYLRRLARYLRYPTQITPPLPPDWPCAHLALFRHNRLYAESLIRFPHEMFSASPSTLDVSMGMNRLIRLPDSLRLIARGRPVTNTPLGPRHPKGLLSLDLTLHTISPPVAPEPLFGGHHLWSPVASPCTARGEISLRSGNGASAKVEVIPLTGRATIDHDLGTRPLADDFSAWLRGVAFLPRATIPIRIACPTARQADPLAAIFDPLSQFHPLPPTASRTTWTQSKRPHPTYFDASPHVRLDSPQILDSRGPLLHLLYRATTPANETGHALCQLLHPGHVPARTGRMFVRPR